MNPFLFGNPAGVGQQTLAGKIIVANAAGNGGARAPRRKARKSRTARATTRRAAARKPRAKKARLVKGSRAAKAYMAKIRRKRR